MYLRLSLESIEKNTFQLLKHNSQVRNNQVLLLDLGLWLFHCLFSGTGPCLVERQFGVSTVLKGLKSWLQCESTFTFWNHSTWTPATAVSGFASVPVGLSVTPFFVQASVFWCSLQTCSSTSHTSCHQCGRTWLPAVITLEWPSLLFLATWFPLSAQFSSFTLHYLAVGVDWHAGLCTMTQTSEGLLSTSGNNFSASCLLSATTTAGLRPAFGFQLVCNVAVGTSSFAGVFITL